MIFAAVCRERVRETERERGARPITIYGEGEKRLLPHDVFYTYYLKKRKKKNVQGTVGFNASAHYPAADDRVGSNHVRNGGIGESELD